MPVTGERGKGGCGPDAEAAVELRSFQLSKWAQIRLRHRVGASSPEDQDITVQLLPEVLADTTDGVTSCSRELSLLLAVFAFTQVLIRRRPHIDKLPRTLDILGSHLTW